MSADSFKYIRYIDGLRAVAVAGVFINHLNDELLKSGFLGVDIFFVISGFVITGSLARTSHLNLRAFLKHFYRRRLLRIFPALLFYLLIVGLVTALVVPNPSLYLKTGVSAVFGFSNILLANEAVNYFGTDAAFNPFTQTWSLGVEEQFYLVIPVMLWFCFKSRRVDIPNNNQRLPTSLIRAIGLLSLVSLFLFSITALVRPPIAYFLMPFRFWEMGLGVLAFEARTKMFANKNLTSVNRDFISAVSFVIIIVSLFVVRDYQIVSTIIVCLATANLIVTTGELSPTARILSWSPLVYLGKLSYSLYLWHWGLIALSKWGFEYSRYSNTFIVVMTLLISTASYHLIEQRFRYIRHAPDRLVFGVGLSSILLSSVAFLGFENISALAAVGSKNNNERVSALTGQGNVHDQLKECHTPKDITRMVDKCLGGDLVLSPNRQALYIIGDSHASQLYPSVVSSLKALGRNPYVFYLAENGFVMSITNSGLLNQFLRRDACFGFVGSSCLHNSFSTIKDLFSNRLRPGDIVIFSLASYRVTNDVNSRLPRSYNTNSVSTLQNSLKELGRAIKATGASLVLIDDIIATCKYPGLNYEFLILTKGHLEACTIDKSIGLKDRAGFTMALKNSAAALDNVYYYDFASDLCDEEICSVIDPKSKRLLYSDSRNHFTATYPDPFRDQMIRMFEEVKPMTR